MSDPPISEFIVGRQLFYSTWSNTDIHTIVTIISTDEYSNLFSVKFSNGKTGYFCFSYPDHPGHWVFVDEISLPEDLID